MSALALYNPKSSKITASSSPIKMREKSVSIVLSKKERGGSLIKVKKKISENNDKLILVTNKLNQIQRVKVKTERVQINQLKAEPAAEQKVRTEKFLEKTPEKKEKKKEGLEIPKPSKPNLFDRLFKFLALTGLNWLIGKLSDKASGITGIFDFIQNVLENIVEWFPKFLDVTFKFFETVGPWIQRIGQFVFNAFVGAIDLAYQTYDGLRSLTGTVFGDKGVKRFDEFSGVLNNVIAGAITLGTAMIMFSDDLKGFGNKGEKGTAGKGSGSNSKSYFKRSEAAKLIEKKYGNAAAKLYELRKSQGASTSRAHADVLKKFSTLEQKFGTQRGLSGGTGKGKIFGRGLNKVAKRTATKVLGKAGRKLVRGLFKRIPIVGGLIDFVFSLAMGEPIGRAAAKSVGATLGGALGTLIPIPFVGTALGSVLGDLVGGSVYDAVVGGNDNDDIQELNSGGRVKIGSQDFRDLAYIVSGEAARNTNDEYGVAAAVLNRVASPVWPNSVRAVGFQAGQFEAVYTGKAKDDPKLAEKLASPEGQAKIASAMRLLNGRTDFKGQSMLSNKGSSDIMFHPRGNFFHYTSQRKKDDPVPQNPSKSWEKLIGSGGPRIDLSTTNAPSGSVESLEKKQMINPLAILLNKLGIGGSKGSIGSSPSSESTPSTETLKVPAQISSTPSTSLNNMKSNITKTAQSLPYQKARVATKVAVLVKEKTRNILT